MVPLFESPARTAPSTSRRRWLAAGAGAAALAALPAWSQSAGAARTLRVGHQKGWLSLLKARGTLEKRLAAVGVKVTWTEFNAGPVQLEALNVGSIDFGDVGEAPPIFAQAARAPLPAPRCRARRWRPWWCPRTRPSAAWPT